MAPATHLSGYLKKEGKKQSLLVRTQKRFFRVEEIAPQRGDEPRLALCYYRREADAEPRGWLFLGDVEAVRDAGPALFVVEHPSRSYVLHASDAAGNDRYDDAVDDLDALNQEMDDILYDREPPKRDKPRRDRPQRDAYDFVPPKRGHDDDQDELDSPPRRRDRDDRRRDDERDRRDRRDDRDRRYEDRDRRDDGDRRAHDPTPDRQPRWKERKSTTPVASPLFDDEIDLGTEIVRPALDESDDRFEAKRFAPSPTAAPSPAKTPDVAKKAATPEAAPVVQQAPPSAPTKSKTPVRIARRGVGGDELAIDWNDDKPRKKPPSALARRLARGERPAKAKAKSKRAPKAAPPADEESTEDVIATLAKERERLARKASVQGARDEAEKAAKKKAKEEKRRRKAEKKARKEKAAAPDNEIKSLFANAVKPDANFVEDDWDASPAKPAPRASGPIGGFGAVKPDANFVEEDWDAE